MCLPFFTPFAQPSATTCVACLRVRVRALAREGKTAKARTTTNVGAASLRQRNALPEEIIVQPAKSLASWEDDGCWSGFWLAISRNGALHGLGKVGGVLNDQAARRAAPRSDRELGRRPGRG